MIPAVLTACGMMTQLAIGQSVGETYGLTGKEVVAAFDGLYGNLADLLHARERTAERALGEVAG